MKKTKQLVIFPRTGFSFKLTKEQLDSLSAKPLARLGMRISFLAIGLSLVGLGLSWRKLPPEVPMLYSLPYGESQLVKAWNLLILPGLALLINAVCLKIASLVLDEEELLAEILVWIGCLIAIMETITLIKIIWLVV